MPNPDVIYHYTTAQGVLGILSEGALHATDIRHLNDRSELEIAWSRLQDAVEARLAVLDDPARAPFGLSVLHSALQDYANETQFGPFIVSFCEEGDLLSQWRGYGQGGYALGFATDALREIEALPPTDRLGGPPLPDSQGATVDLVQVGYEDSTHRYMVESLVADAEAGFPGNYPDLFVATFKRLASLKDPGFSEEREWRLMTMPWAGQVLESFRARPSGAIVPYVPIPFDVRSALCDVVIGPGTYPHVAPPLGQQDSWPGGRDAVHRLLARHGIAGVSPRFSAIPFR